MASATSEAVEPEPLPECAERIDAQRFVHLLAARPTAGAVLSWESACFTRIPACALRRDWLPLAKRPSYALSLRPRQSR